MIMRHACLCNRAIQCESSFGGLEESVIEVHTAFEGVVLGSEILSWYSLVDHIYVEPYFFLSVYHYVYISIGFFFSVIFWGGANFSRLSSERDHYIL